MDALRAERTIDAGLKACPRRFAPFTQLRVSHHAALLAVACPASSAEQASSLPTENPPFKPHGPEATVQDSGKVLSYQDAYRHSHSY